MAAARWHVTGHYSMLVEAETEAEAIDRACDKIGSGWEWEAEEVPGGGDAAVMVCTCDDGGSAGCPIHDQWEAD